ncbi:hypothetical protein ACFDR9_004400, partial [Janthinobacterium sp. CG_23.3]|uniref:hypothetical protein n=1 Tax=Janthinobacterium sp. CG_23.3 TaxID=3349634 RepID=UPI0038D3CF8D
MCVATSAAPDAARGGCCIYPFLEKFAPGQMVLTAEDATLFVTVQPLCGKRDRITVEGPEQNLKHAMALLA